MSTMTEPQTIETPEALRQQAIEHLRAGLAAAGKLRGAGDHRLIEVREALEVAADEAGVSQVLAIGRDYLDARISRELRTLRRFDEETEQLRVASIAAAVARRQARELEAQEQARRQQEAALRRQDVDEGAQLRAESQALRQRQEAEIAALLAEGEEASDGDAVRSRPGETLADLVDRVNGNPARGRGAKP